MRTFQASHRLGEVERYAEVNPDLDLPPIQYRESLEPGDLAMLLDEELPEGAASVWVEVQQVFAPGQYLGHTEAGAPIQFGAEHVADLEHAQEASLGMGAWYDTFRPQPPRPKPPVSGVFRHFARGQAAVPPTEPRPEKPRGSIFDIFKRGAPKGSFFDLFRGKPKAEVEPIPPAERRESRPSFLRLPGPEVPEKVQETPQEAAQAPAQAVMVPEVQATLQRMPEARQDPPDELFSILLPPEERPTPPAPTSGAVIVAPEAHLPAQADAFSILEPEQPAFGPPALAPSPFELLVPEAERPSPFDILTETEESTPGAMTVRTQGGEISTASMFDILEPEAPAPREVSVYQPPTAAAPPPGPTVFDPLEREEAPRAARPKERKKAAASRKWRMPSEQEWVAWIKRTFDLPDLWRYLEENRQTEQFLEEQLNEEETYEPPVIPIETFTSMEWDVVFEFFGIPEEAWLPYIKQIETEEESDGYSDEGWQKFNEEFLYPLGNILSDAFKSLQPKSLPGRVVLDDDGQTGTWGLLYYEPLPEEQKVKRRKEVREANAKAEKERKERENHFKTQLKRIWGAMPEPDEIVSWIEEKFDLDAMFSDIKKVRKTRQWKADLEYGDAQHILEVVSKIGPKRSKDYNYDVASYFGIPPDVVSLYEEADSDQDLWDDVFWPFFANISEAFSMLLPYADLPGEIVVDEDEEDNLAIIYTE